MEILKGKKQLNIVKYLFFSLAFAIQFWGWKNFLVHVVNLKFFEK